MRIGYACINESVSSNFRTCRLRTYQTEGTSKIKELTLHNLNEVYRILQWNVEHDLFFFRMSSELIPLASHEQMTWKWYEDPDVRELCHKIKAFAHQHHVRLSVHPGQYTLLNSPNADVVARSIEDLHYHALLVSLTSGSDMILHVGGGYGDKEAAMNRFIDVYQTLSPLIKTYLRIENDDKVFSAEEVLNVSKQTGIPVCFDIHHHRCLPSATSDETLLNAIFETWKDHGIPKMHISSGKTGPTDRSHHEYILDEDVLSFLKLLKGRDIDLMIEAKRKDLAALNVVKMLKDRKMTH